MRILQVTAGLNEGGVERGTLEMAAFIISQGSESIVASNGGKLVAKLKQSGATHIQLPLVRRDPVSILINALRLRRFIKSAQIDLVHARSRAPAWSAWLACRLATGRTKFRTGLNAYTTALWFEEKELSLLVSSSKLM